VTSIADELAMLLRPSGGGVHLVSTGREEQLALQRRLYAATTEAEVEERFRAQLDRLASAKILILGVPSDVGAGFRRGANLAPAAIRMALLESWPDWPEWAAANGVVDVGDVRVVPQLLHDEMLSADQLARSRSALYGNAHSTLPVSPLSIEERALDHLLALAPNAAPLILGGDHSVAWPVTAALHRARPGFGIVQPDAHTDLLEDRLGIKYCFATWSFHANELLGGGGRLVQVGVRASRHPREHWEKLYGVRQFWAHEIERDPDAALDAIAYHVRASGVRGVYFSNDIDGTDARFASSTGTPETGGFDPDFLVALIERLGREVGIVAADLVEVAPPLGSREERETTMRTAVRYLRATIDAMLAPTSRLTSPKI
jgi:arginase family enzyme